MKVSGQLHVPAALFPEKRPRYQLVGSWVGLRAGVDAVAKNIKHATIRITENTIIPAAHCSVLEKTRFSNSCSCA
jgi:hypothetical protein